MASKKYLDQCQAIILRVSVKHHKKSFKKEIWKFGYMRGHPPPNSSHWHWPPTCQESNNIIKSYLQALSHDKVEWILLTITSCIVSFRHNTKNRSHNWAKLSYIPHVTKYVFMKVGKAIIRCHTKQNGIHHFWGTILVYNLWGSILNLFLFRKMIHSIPTLKVRLYSTTV